MIFAYVGSDEFESMNGSSSSSSSSSGCSPGYYSVGNNACCPIGDIFDGTYCVSPRTSGSQTGGSQGTTSGGNCGGYGTLFVTQPISVYTAAVVEVDGYAVGITNMEITVAAGSHHVRAWGVTTSGFEQSMSWNIYVDDCKQSLIKWN